MTANNEKSNILSTSEEISRSISTYSNYSIYYARYHLKIIILNSLFQKLKKTLSLKK